MAFLRIFHCFSPFNCRIRSIFACKRDKSHRHQGFPDEFAVPFSSQKYQVADAAVRPEGNNHPTPFCQLVNQGLRQLLCPCRNDDRIKRSLTGPAVVAVTDAHMDIFISK